MKKSLLAILCLLILASCQKEPDSSLDNNSSSDDPSMEDPNPNDGNPVTDWIAFTFGDRINLDNPPNYSSQVIPNYINDDNSGGNAITNNSALLGRVLFYDKNLSSDNTVSCASCHKQANGFGDFATLSQGVNGLTGRHSMRLVNARFGNERRFFWDERANSLEQQTTMPIQDHTEMGFSGQNGDPDFGDLILKLESEEYYQELFTAAYGSAEITEQRMQNALADFVRSIQSFDTKYDIGRAQSNNDNQPFQNFTQLENQGKDLFMRGPQFQGGSGNRVGGGLGCDGCHRAPEFDITPNSRNNGVTGIAGSPNGFDGSITRSPSLRDIFDSNGNLNGPLMHTGSFTTIDMVIDHYNVINAAGNNNLDNRLARGGGIRLNITTQERAALIAFLKTLSGSDVYTNEKWSDPF